MVEVEVVSSSSGFSVGLSSDIVDASDIFVVVIVVVGIPTSRFVVFCPESTCVVVSMSVVVVSRSVFSQIERKDFNDGSELSLDVVKLEGSRVVEGCSKSTVYSKRKESVKGLHSKLKTLIFLPRIV